MVVTYSNQLNLNDCQKNENGGSEFIPKISAGSLLEVEKRIEYDK